MTLSYGAEFSGNLVANTAAETTTFKHDVFSERAAQRLGAQPHQTALTVSAGAEALNARLYHGTIGFGCLVPDALPR